MLLADSSSASNRDTKVVVSSTSRVSSISEHISDSSLISNTWYDGLKRTIDLVGAAFLLVLLAPVMAIVILAVRLTSSGPAVYTQKRLTAGGRVFTMYKFRSMFVDAETRTGAVWAASDDPRVTKVGKFLRVSRLDELPQLLNVLMGDMSLIGPRPERPELAEQLAKELPDFNRRMEVKAGLTGLAQTMSGYASSVRSYRRKLALDLIYINNRCLMLDLKIALKTVLVILTGSGAR